MKEKAYPITFKQFKKQLLSRMFNNDQKQLNDYLNQLLKITFILSKGKEVSLFQQINDVLEGKQNSDYIKIQDISFFEYFIKEEGYDLNKDVSLFNEAEQALYTLRKLENDNTEIVATTFIRWDTYLEHMYDDLNLLLPISTDIYLKDEKGKRIMTFPSLRKPLLLTKKMFHGDQSCKWEKEVSENNLTKISLDVINKYRNTQKVEVALRYFEDCIKIMIKPDVSVYVYHYGDKKFEEDLQGFMINHSFIQKRQLQNFYEFEREVETEIEERRIRENMARRFRNLIN